MQTKAQRWADPEALLWRPLMFSLFVWPKDQLPQYIWQARRAPHRGGARPHLHCVSWPGPSQVEGGRGTAEEEGEMEVAGTAEGMTKQHLLTPISGRSRLLLINLYDFWTWRWATAAAHGVEKGEGNLRLTSSFKATP